MATLTQTMTTQEIAERMVELCRKGDYETAQREMYAQDCVSIEPHSSMGFEKEVKGLDMIFAKGRKFNEMVDQIYGGSVSQPAIADNSFAFAMTIDAKFKGSERKKMTELCVYKVKDGKIVSEEFLM